MLSKICLLLVSFVLLETMQVEVAAEGEVGMKKADYKDLAFKGKGKGKDEAAREEMCRKVCEDKVTPSVYVNPWNPSHQICACWDSEDYRKNMEALKCEKSKDALFYVGGETYTCSGMCKKYLNDMFGEKTFVRLRESLLCQAKMMYGPTYTCFCDYKFTGENPHMLQF